MSDATAISLGISSIAGWLAVEQRAEVAPGEHVLVLGASGPVGLAAAQAARLLGAGRVVVAARHRESLVRLVDLGLADDMVDLGVDAADIAGSLRDSASGRGYDVVIDPLFGNILPAALTAMTRRGRAVVLGRSAGERATLPWVDLASRSVLSYNNVETSHHVKAAAYRRLMAHAVAGEFFIPTQYVRLDDVAALWDQLNASPHAKLVMRP